MGSLARPDWHALSSGAPPEAPTDAVPGELSHSWQYYASYFSEHHFRRNRVLDQLSAARLICCQSGPCASDVLCGCLQARVPYRGWSFQNSHFGETQIAFTGGRGSV